MPDAILILTFSPVQAFIAEARRTSDLFVGSKILVRMAKAAGETLRNLGRLVYPADLGEGVPNKLVVLVPWREARTVAEKGQAALLEEWNQIARSARVKLEHLGPCPDDMWNAIWERQVTRFWEVYWAAASMEGRSYRETYREAERVLEGLKRTRSFAPSEEPDLKDSLSGQRQALRTERYGAKDYWLAVVQHVGSSRLQPEGRERLDALGAIKRFSYLADKRFPSTSTVASTDFLAKARGHLTRYREVLEDLMAEHRPRQDDEEWPYDGDLLYLETLNKKRLKDGYGIEELESPLLERAREELREVYKIVKAQPSPYYGLIVLDGDRIGERIDDCLRAEDPEKAHHDLSLSILEFSRHVDNIVEEHIGAKVVYNGGDDVMALAPLSEALPLAQSLAEKYQAVTGGTASAGISIAHHLYPLDAVVRSAREAERKAKEVKDKASVCVMMLKRSGTRTVMRSPWTTFVPIFDKVVDLFKEEGSKKAVLAGRFAYDVARAAYALPTADAKLRAELRRLLNRHGDAQYLEASGDANEWAENLQNWAQTLPEQAEELGRWLMLARFIARGGIER